jgi:hypothetical protein
MEKGLLRLKEVVPDKQLEWKMEPFDSAEMQG